jgi:hypothetical protein
MISRIQFRQLKNQKTKTIINNMKREVLLFINKTQTMIIPGLAQW